MSYAPSIEVDRPEHVDIEDAKRRAKEEGVNTFKPFENEEEYEGGNVRALFIGVNYVGSAAELSGCVNDVAQTLATMDEIDFPIKEAAILVDDPTFPNVSDAPTNANFKKYMGWLIDDAKAGDVLYLHYSGHGGRLPSQNDKYEDYDSAILPNDYETQGAIIDDDLFEILAKPLPAGVRMTVCFDCCHSASMLDLPYSFVADKKIPDSDGTTQQHYTMEQVRQDNFSSGDVMMIAGCADDDTSADVSNTASFGSSDIEGAGGAATQAWTYMLENQHGARYIDAILQTRKVLADKGFTQVPQLSSSKPIDLDEPFSLFGTLDVDKDMENTLPPEVAQQAKPEIKGIPKRFRHNKMQDFDPSAFAEGFIPVHLKDKKKTHSKWCQNSWLAGHPDPRQFHRMGKRPLPPNNIRDIRKKKMRVNPSMDVDQFIKEVTAIVEPQVDKQVKLYVNGQPLEEMSGHNMYDLYENHKDEDGFLYCCYAPADAPIEGNVNHIGMYRRTHTTNRRVGESNKALGENKIPAIIERMDLPMPPFDVMQCMHDHGAEHGHGQQDQYRELGDDEDASQGQQQQQHGTRDIDLNNMRELGEEDVQDQQQEEEHQHEQADMNDLRELGEEDVSKQQHHHHQDNGEEDEYRELGDEDENQGGNNGDDEDEYAEL